MSRERMNESRPPEQEPWSVLCGALMLLSFCPGGRRTATYHIGKQTSQFVWVLEHQSCCLEASPPNFVGVWAAQKKRKKEEGGYG